MTSPGSYRSVLRVYNGCSDPIRNFYCNFEGLLNDYEYEVSVAYVFLKLEQAYNRCLYGGVRKLHKVNAEIASTIMQKQHLTREGFLRLFENVFSQPLNSDVVKKIKFAEKVRDKIIHGKSVQDADKRKCLTDVLQYSREIEREVENIGGFNPFGDMRGVTGRAKPLEKSTSRWVMKGLGFAID